MCAAPGLSKICHGFSSAAPRSLHALIDFATEGPDYTDQLSHDELFTLLAAGHDGDGCKALGECEGGSGHG
ncbi:hypothetical protein ABIE67_000545 [Streptomyces sp. V4I8]